MSRAHRLIRRRHRETLAERGEQLLGASPVQIADHAVVVEDGHLVMRKNHREEIAVRAGRAAAPLRDPGGRGGTVVPVGDVDRRQRVEGFGQGANGGLVIDHPHLVPDAVVGGDVDLGVTQGGF